MPVVTAEQVRDYLSNPRWSESQIRACEQLIKGRQTQLQAWFRMPIDPGPERTDNAPVYTDTGLVATTYPIYTLLALDGVAVAGGVPPSPYELRDGAWLYNRDYDEVAYSYTSRPFSLVSGAAVPRTVVRYLPGWGAKDDIVTAIIEKVAAVMLNRHDDTVVARNLDAKTPDPLEEKWTEEELAMLRARRRPVGARP